MVPASGTKAPWISHAEKHQKCRIVSDAAFEKNFIAKQAFSGGKLAAAGYFLAEATIPHSMMLKIP